MARRKVCTSWTLVLFLILVCPFVFSRPQETVPSIKVTSSSTNSVNNPTTETPRDSLQKQDDAKAPERDATAPVLPSEASRRVKTKGPVLGESIKMVATQLLENHANKSSNTPIITDSRIPPKLKSHLDHKHKIKTRNEDGNESIENTHIGVAVPITMEDLEKENKLTDTNESSTSNEGISTWILLSNPTNKENMPSSTEPTKQEEPSKKQKPSSTKNKNKRPQNKISAKRPIIGSTNKSDLVAGGSAINENVLNKIKDTVLTNVQKNKNTHTPTTVSSTITTLAPDTETPATKKEVVTKATPVIPVVKVTSKPMKKKNKNKQKTTTTAAPTENESALLPIEAKEQEIELEISTPATTTKKPKRTSTKKRNKTKKRKTTKPKPEVETSVSEIKTSNKTKSVKTSKKPATAVSTGPFTTQIYNYLSREVMPSVGVGVIGLASLVGLASYFFYPFTTPVRRTLEVDKKDDLYRHNAEEYASEGNGQAEEEMLGTVLAGMPAHTRHKLNPYAGQTTAQVSRYPVKKEQDLRYRHVANKYESSQPTYNVHYPQQKTGIAHGAVYSEPVNYNPQQYETRHGYTTESKYTYEKASSAHTPYSAVEPIYASSQTGPSGMSSFGNDASNSVVYGVKPSADTEFKPVYHFDGQFYSETTSNPVTYPPTSMYLGSNDDTEKEQPEMVFGENANEKSDIIDAKFVVGNVPKEIIDSATPAVVPEHGPRNLSRRKRSALLKKRSIVGSIEEIIKATKENNKDDIFISNEIDGNLGITTKRLPSMKEEMKNEAETKPKEVFPVYAVSVDPSKEEKATTEPATTMKNDIIESVSTLPIDQNREEKTSVTDMSNELETTTKSFKIYEVFTTSNPPAVSEQSSSLSDSSAKAETTTPPKNLNTETTTELKSDATFTVPPSSPILETKAPTLNPVTQKPKPTYYPEVITYPPTNQEGGFFTFLKRLVEFKYRLGLSILQTTSDSLNRYLRNIERSIKS